MSIYHQSVILLNLELMHVAEEEWINLTILLMSTPYITFATSLSCTPRWTLKLTMHSVKILPSSKYEVSEHQNNPFGSRYLINPSTDWWENKVMHKWIAPSINRHLSSIPKEHWDLMPADTNAMEGSHANDNRERGTNRSLVDAVLM